MRFRIHFEWPDGTADSFIAEGDSVEDVREQAQTGVKLRDGRNPWSEELEGE